MARGDTSPPGCRLLDLVHEFLGRFIAYPSEDAHIAHSLWVAHAHLMNISEATPRIAFLSPEPASGKTRALEVTELLVPRPVEAVNATPAYLFRKAAAPEGRPTILYDEIDAVFGPKAKENEEVRALLNAGHRRGAKACRCVVRGKTVCTEEIEAFCAVALAGIGALPDTILSRSIVIGMRRRAAGEYVEPFRRRVHGANGHKLRDRLTNWAAQLERKWDSSRWPSLPLGVEDRDADVWEPLIAIADAAGGDWPTRARAACVTLVTASKENRDSLGVQLLSDLRMIFEDQESMPTTAILNKLTALQEAPWGCLEGRPLDPRRLASLLRPYGVRSTTIRTGQLVSKGYAKQSLLDPWRRYLPVSPPLHEKRNTRNRQPAK